jgi:8-oxo-dGTP diphosphatase
MVEQPVTHAELCVGAVVVRSGRLLLIRRGRGAGQGLWSIPGGRVERGETMVGAVLRELHEETGLVGHTPRHLGFVERIGPGWHFVIHDYSVGVDDSTRATAGDDACDVDWYPLGELAEHPAIVPGLVEFLIEVGIAPR